MQILSDMRMTGFIKALLQGRENSAKHDTAIPTEVYL